MRSTRESPSLPAPPSPYLLDASAKEFTDIVQRFAGRRIFFDGVFKGDYSLAIVNRNIARQLLKQLADLTIFSAEADVYNDLMLSEMPDVKSRLINRYPDKGSFDIHLRNTWPPIASDMIGKFNAYVCYAWEELEYPADLVDHFNKYLDLVMVTSNFVRYSLLHSGVKIPVEVVGNGTDHLEAELTLGVPAAETTGRATFLHVSSCFPRKGADLLIHAFAKGFSSSDPVELVIKTFPNPHNTIEAIIDNVRKDFPGAPPIRVINATVPNHEMVALYKGATAMVAPTRGEGFGLPLAEAMLASVPVVTTAYSGQTDFCSRKTAWIVDYRLVRSNAHVTGDYGVWAEPIAESLVEQMRRVLSEPDEVARRTRNAQALLRAHFKWSDVARRIALAVDRWSAGRAAEPQAIAPKSIELVSTWNQSCGVATYSEHLFETPALGPSLRRVLAREIRGDTVGERPIKLARPDVVLRPWGYDSQGIARLAERLSSGSAEVLWIQHHPGFFSPEDMLALAPSIKAGDYKIRAITLHNVRESRASAGWLDTFDIAFVHTPADAEFLSRSNYSRIAVIPHGIVSAPACVDSELRPFTIGTFGFLYPHKCVCDLVYAVARARLVLPDIRLKLFTCVQKNEKSGLERARVETLIDDCGLHDHVEANFDFLSDNEIIRGLQSCDLLCFPYGQSQESATGAVRIAMAADRPLLCSKSSVLRDVFPYAHILVDSGPNNLAEAIVVLSGHSELLHMYDSVRRLYVERHRYERIASRISAHFQYLRGTA